MKFHSLTVRKLPLLVPQPRQRNSNHQHFGGKYYRPQPVYVSQARLLHQERLPSENLSNQYEKYIGIGVGIASILLENVFSQPFIAFRRQCQVNFKAAHYHRTPVTVIPIMYNVQHNQDFGSLWKGVSSSIVLRGISVASENLMSEVLDYPKVIMSPNSWMIVMKHLALKAISFAVTTPIMISAFLETVQTSLDREKPGLFDCVFEGFKRIYNDVMGPRGHPRFSVFNLTVPTVAYRLLFYVTQKVFRWHMYNSVKSHRANRSEQNKSPFDKYFPEVFTALTSDLFTEALLYPFETVLHRLYLQGTRTLIDNLDDGCSVMPIMTRYEGVIDCIRTIKLDEGIGGFYKGFGALVLQYMLHLGLVHTFRLIYEYFDRNMEAMITGESREFDNDNHQVENV
ncbi:Solute carrier family 25 member 46 [Trichinella pseudospiralis]|uniref:Solute carrier family 25 member 46 n=1 Tax=Trichinella pseudospiralis TaxID=6337 RepID=A0A0V1J128_TRIPS|nr:Solute carrier family 25 member 46 [Trichinella pseudospiralis]